MSNYNSVTPEFIDELKTLLGEKYVKTDADTLDRYKTDEEADERCFNLPDAVVIPANAEEIAGVVLLMERLNKIIELNKEGLYMVAQAGVRTLDIQAAAKAENLLYAGDPSSSDSCQIGGNLATNAGGIKAVRYGAIRSTLCRLLRPTATLLTWARR